MPTPKQYADALSSPSWTDRALPMEGRAAFLPFQDTLPGSVMNKRSLAIPGVFAGAINAITAPGRAYRGSDPTFNPQEEALNIGLNMMGGGMVASKIAPPPAGSLGIFAGSRAKTANMEALKVANEMKASGVPDEAIHAKTGWFFGMPDRKPRFEIDDSGASIKNFGKNQDDSMINVLNHQGLYDAYPAQEYTHANITSETTLPPHLRKLLIGKGEGSYNHTGYGGEPLIEATAFSPKDTSTILHELQHAIQQREGFAKGGSPDSAAAEYAQLTIKPKLNRLNEEIINLGKGRDALNGKEYAANVARHKELVGARDSLDDELRNLSDNQAPKHSIYNRLAGEAEARLTQSRMNMTAPERAASYPPSMFDVPVKEQIVRYGEGQSMSVPTKFPQPDGELRSAIAQLNAAKPISEGGLGLPADNMPMDRAGAMGFDTPAYHGSDNGDITKFSNRKAYRGYGTSVAEQPKTAEGYAQNGSMYPLLINKNTIFDVTNPSQVEQLSQVTDKYLAKRKPYDGKTTFYPFTKEDVFEGFKKPHSEYYAEQNLISELVKKMGYTGTKALENNIPQYKIFNPADIRSRFAAFDPFRKHEADILAGVGIGGMLDPEFVSEEFRKKERK